VSDTAGKSPDWAPFFAPEEWAIFVATLGWDLDRRGMKHRIDLDSGCVHVEIPPQMRVPNVLGLQNIAQVCRGRPRDRWAELIAHHFDVAFDVKDGIAADALAKDWSRAKDAVKLRLYVEQHVPNVPVVTWPIADGLVAVLTFDLPDTVISVRSEDREGWEIDDDALFAIALANVKKDGILSTSSVDLGHDTTLSVIEGGGTFFGATHALLLDDYVPSAARHGAVLAIPHRHVVVFHPLIDLRAVRAIQTMIVSTAKMYAEGPGSISMDLYWWRRDRALLRLACELEGDTIRFVPHADFVALMESLPPPPTG
jgi:hypothetical protein